MEDLEVLRAKLDTIDDSIVDLLAKRRLLIEQVTEFKAINRMEALQPARFSKMLDRLHKKAAELGVDERLIDDIWNAIHKQSLNQESDALSK